MFSSELLPIYLNDHLAGSTFGRDLARRAAGANRDTELGGFLAELASQIEADRALLKDVMARLDVSEDTIKVSAGWLAEKFGRLKLNGRLTEYSPLSRVLELEGLALGVRGKLSLWRTLAAAAPDEPRIVDVDFVHLIERAEAQLAGIDAHHARAAELMLAERA
ncbi:MAG: hypothetical protein ACJ77Z_17770 [Thermoleophilaceae bacterium]